MCGIGFQFAPQRVEVLAQIGLALLDVRGPQTWSSSCRWLTSLPGLRSRISRSRHSVLARCTGGSTLWWARSIVCSPTSAVGASSRSPIRRLIARTLAISSLMSNGLVTKSSAPALSACTLSKVSACRQHQDRYVGLAPGAHWSPPGRPCPAGRGRAPPGSVDAVQPPPARRRRCRLHDVEATGAVSSRLETRRSSRARLDGAVARRSLRSARRSQPLCPPGSRRPVEGLRVLGLIAVIPRHLLTTIQGTRPVGAERASREASVTTSRTGKQATSMVGRAAQGARPDRSPVRLAGFHP